MEKTTGELSLTVVTVVAIVAIAGFVTAFLWPTIKDWIGDSFGQMGMNATIGE